VRTVHHTELIFVVSKNLSVPLQDICAERANTYHLMYSHWSTKDGCVHQTASNSTRHALRHIRSHSCPLSRNSIANSDPEMRSSRTAEKSSFTLHLFPFSKNVRVNHTSFFKVLLLLLLTYLLTPWGRVLLDKLTGLQLVKKFSAFYGTRRFLTALTSARHLDLS
jgi:hypothetical protein